MNSNTIMDSLKDELKTIQSSTSPYKSDISEIMRGIHGHMDTTNRPFIGIAIEKDELENSTFGTDDIWRVSILLYCYMETGDNLGDYSVMYQMIEDIKYFLKHNWSHNGNTTVTSVNPIEGGVNPAINYFDITLSILYQEDI